MGIPVIQQSKKKKKKKKPQGKDNACSHVLNPADVSTERQEANATFDYKRSHSEAYQKEGGLIQVQIQNGRLKKSLAKIKTAPMVSGELKGGDKTAVSKRQRAFKDQKEKYFRSGRVGGEASLSSPLKERGVDRLNGGPADLAS